MHFVDKNCAISDIASFCNNNFAAFTEAIKPDVIFLIKTITIVEIVVEVICVTATTRNGEAKHNVLLNMKI